MAIENTSVTGKRRILLQMLMQQRIDAASNPVIPKAVRASSLLPTTSVQQGIWFLEALSPASSLHNYALLRRLVGKLDVAALSAAMNAVVVRHEILRTAFSAPDGLPVQTVAPEQIITPHWINLQDRDIQSREREALRLATEDAARPFDLVHGPLLRMTLLKLDAEEHWLLLNFHHLVFDGGSVGVLCTELSALYAAYCHGNSVSLSELRIQYADYAFWQQERLQSAAQQDQLEYWKRQLQGSPSGLAFPTDQPRPAQQLFCGASHALVCDECLVNDLLALSRQEGTTLFITVVSAFAVLLQRYSRQEELLIGTHVANRLPETRPLIGCFNNTVILRADLAGDPAFRELLGRMRETCLGAYANQEIPFERVVETLRPQHDSNWSPFTNILFQLQTDVEEQREITLQGLDTSRIPMPRTAVPGDLMLNLIHSSQGVRGAFEYRADLFRQETIARMEGQLQTLLRSIVATPDLCISQLAFLMPGETQQLLCDGVAARTGLPVLPQGSPEVCDVQQDRVAPQNDLERRLLVVWENALQIRAIGATHNFFDLGGRSLLAIRLLHEVNREFGIPLSLAEMLKAPTIRGMAQLLAGKQQGASRWSSLVPLQPYGTRPPLFLAPPGGGSVFYYRTLAAAIGAEQPLYALEPHGLGDGLAPHETYEAMAAFYIEQIRAIQTTGPYYLGGYSAGGIIAYEMARQLQAVGEAVALLLLLDTSAPEWDPGKSERRQPPHRLLQQWWRVLYHGRQYLSEWSACATRPEKRAYLRKKSGELCLRARYRLVNKAWERPVNPAQAALPEAYQALGVAERKAHAAYRPAPGYTGRVRLLRAQVPWPGKHEDVEAAWRALVEGDFALVETPGTHYSFLEEPCVRISVAHIRQLLTEAQRLRAKR